MLDNDCGNIICELNGCLGTCPSALERKARLAQGRPVAASSKAVATTPPPIPLVEIPRLNSAERGAVGLHDWIERKLKRRPPPPVHVALPAPMTTVTPLPEEPAMPPDITDPGEGALRFSETPTPAPQGIMGLQQPAVRAVPVQQRFPGGDIRLVTAKTGRTCTLIVGGELWDSASSPDELAEIVRAWAMGASPG